MTGSAHACLGALVGSFFRAKPRAFVAGAASHALGDMFPHREAPLWADALLTPIVLTWISRKFGVNSSEMAGALGGLSPDIEHLPAALGVREEYGSLFPTHNHLLPHGRSDEYLSQILIGAGALLALAMRSRQR
ncbi:MAG: hypothetical protein IT209_06515 [Armatimonadetes bacterium]|nr:hypothetical protein [Armatimonadota bacterium]